MRVQMVRGAVAQRRDDRTLGVVHLRSIEVGFAVGVPSGNAFLGCDIEEAARGSGRRPRRSDRPGRRGIDRRSGRMRPAHCAPTAQAAVSAASLDARVLDDHVGTRSGEVSISTMHLAKGLEFRAVAVMACDDEVIPSQVRIETVGDDADLRDVYDTERQLLYVACTRARDHLSVTGVEPASEFLDDLRL